MPSAMVTRLRSPVVSSGRRKLWPMSSMGSESSETVRSTTSSSLEPSVCRSDRRSSCTREVVGSGDFSPSGGSIRRLGSD